MKKRILIIEDEPAIRRLMAMALEPTGYDVAAAEDGPLGLARFGTGAGWDAVLLDQRMPGMEGLEVLRRIRAITTTVPVIMVTAYPSIDLAVDAMKIGACDFIRKPATPEVLRAAIDAATRPRRAAAPEPPARVSTEIETMTLNGFRVLHLPSALDDYTHKFRVMHGADEAGTQFTVTIEPAAVERLKEFTGERHTPGGSFWASRAEDLLAAVLWAEGRLPPQGSLTVKDFSRIELDVALAWPKDTP
jgi:CheY-like chemotaxis protein